jgi:hypothetical protein
LTVIAPILCRFHVLPSPCSILPQVFFSFCLANGCHRTTSSAKRPGTGVPKPRISGLGHVVV